MKKKLSLHLLLIANTVLLTVAANTSAQQSLTTWPTSPAPYQKVLDAGDCGKRLYVDDASIFAADDWVLLVQHRGASAEGEECSRYGKVQEYSAAGNFELARVESVETQPSQGEEYVVLKACPSLFYYAAIWAPGNTDFPNNNLYGYQLVKVHYTDGDLTIDASQQSGTLQAPAWDGATGGVIAIIATGTITLEANIDVSGAGFVGGEPNATDNSDVDQTAYEVSSADKAGNKGAGIVTGSSSLLGRGGMANAGGGGGGKNAGGGGGSNFGAGGHGGDQIGTEDDPNTTADDENQKIGGEGGWPLQYDALNRTQVFFGGGGGGGHRSQKGTTIQNESKGGSGGGIILIMANKMEVDGSRTINASGANGHNAEPGDNGAGGGGGGGTVLLDIPTITIPTGLTGDLTVNVEGGDGGNTNEAHCTGPGGGGGEVLFGSVPVQSHRS
ncbi:MAG: hypothetical protein H6616_06195 [Ignavibacteria bacterium]|nr:hypothetical protein [Ignavibacteria bacterium]